MNYIYATAIVGILSVIYIVLYKINSKIKIETSDEKCEYCSLYTTCHSAPKEEKK